MKRPAFGFGALLTRQFSRRVFAGRIGMTLLALIGAKDALARSASARGPGLDQLLADLFSKPAAARAIGRGYLSAGGDPREQARWQQDMDIRLAREGRRRTLAHLRNHIDADFRSQNIVTLDGWVLSETEARLCAAAARKQTT
jgi:hypothetical protein